MKFVSYISQFRDQILNDISLFVMKDLHRINGYDKDYSGSNNGIWMLNTNSPYLAGGLAAVLLLVLVLVLLTK